MFHKLLVRLVALAALVLPGMAHAEWLRAESKHFVVYANDRPEPLKAFAGELERFDKAMRVLRGLPDPAVPRARRVTVYVVDDLNDMARISGSGNVYGFYAPRLSGSVAFVPRRSGSRFVRDFDGRQILLHEYTHHFMYTMAPNAAFPAWFTEGWAEFHSTARFEEDGAVTFGAPPQNRADDLLDGNALRIEKLLTADTLKLSFPEVMGLYARGWLLVHYLTFGGKRDGQLAAYLTAINEGQTPLEAARVFGDLETLDRELGRYKLGAIKLVTLNPAALAIGEITIATLGKGEAATMNVRIRSQSGVDEKEAGPVYAAAKRACEGYPNDPAAQMVLAEAAYDAKDYAGAEAAADRAIAADPNRLDAYLYKAKARMAVAAKAGDKSKETWNAIRKLIGVANRGDPDDPEPLLLYFETYPAAGQAPTPVSRQGLYRAFQLAPQVPFLRMKAARSYLDEGQPAMARMLLLPLAFAPHNNKLAQEAGALIAEIDRRFPQAKAGGR